MYIRVSMYLNIHQHFHMLKKHYTLKEKSENLDLNTGPELKSVKFTNPVQTVVLLGCFCFAFVPVERIIRLNQYS